MTQRGYLPVAERMARLTGARILRTARCFHEPVVRSEVERLLFTVKLDRGKTYAMERLDSFIEQYRAMMSLREIALLESEFIEMHRVALIEPGATKYGPSGQGSLL